MHFAKGIHKKKHTAETHKCKTQSERLLSMCMSFIIISYSYSYSYRIVIVIVTIIVYIM